VRRGYPTTRSSKHLTEYGNPGSTNPRARQQWRQNLNVQEATGSSLKPIWRQTPAVNDLFPEYLGHRKAKKRVGVLSHHSPCVGALSAGGNSLRSVRTHSVRPCWGITRSPRRTIRRLGDLAHESKPPAHTPNRSLGQRGPRPTSYVRGAEIPAGFGTSIHKKDRGPRRGASFQRVVSWLGAWLHQRHTIGRPASRSQVVTEEGPGIVIERDPRDAGLGDGDRDAADERSPRPASRCCGLSAG